MKTVKRLIGKEGIKVVQILRDHWDRFLKEKGDRIPRNMRSSICEAVEKAMKCGDARYGYAEYLCIDCNGREKKKVAFSCKSRFCNRCGKIYIDKWVEKQVERILEVGHRHLVFSIPEELRIIFYNNREWLKDLSDKAAEVVQHWFKEKAKKRGYEVGIISVVHTFGRDLKFNPHVHALITEGAIDRENNWKEVGYIPYEYLRRAWQKLLLELVKEKYPRSHKHKSLINDLYQRYQEGFYVYAERRMKNARGAARYIGRYLARPAIAEYRITSYDGERVGFWYEDHKTGERVALEMGVLDFMGRLTMHIPQKHFKMVRRYGLYRRQLNRLAQKVVGLWNWMSGKAKQIRIGMAGKSKRWKERLIETFGENPLKCPRCGEEMELWRIWHHQYGTIWDWHKYGVKRIEKEEKEEKAGSGAGSYQRRHNERDDGILRRNGLGSTRRVIGEGREVQLSMSGMWV